MRDSLKSSGPNIGICPSRLVSRLRREESFGILIVMNFELHNVARVREASIRLDGVTVIVGPNGSGKSTISRGLITLRNLMRNLPQRVLHEKARSVFSTFYKFFKESEKDDDGEIPLSFDIRLSVLARSSVQEPAFVCSPEFWNDARSVCEYFFGSDKKESKENEDDVSLRNFIRFMTKFVLE